MNTHSGTKQQWCI